MSIKPGETRQPLASIFLIDRLRVVFADELDAIAVENDNTVFDDFMLLAVEADNVAALDECFHHVNLSDFGIRDRGRTNKSSIVRQAPGVNAPANRVELPPRRRQFSAPQLFQKSAFF